MIQPQYFQQAYPQTPSAVSINIYEPKSYASAPNQVPYGYTNQIYSMPQNSLWGAQPAGYVQSPQYQAPIYFPQQGQIPTQPAQIVNQQPPIYFPQQGQIPTQQTELAPVEQQPMPQSAIEQPEPNPVAAAPATTMPEVEQPAETPKVDTSALVADLKSSDPQAQYEAITSIANFTVATPDLALQVATEPVKQALVDIIKSDTSKLSDLSQEKSAIEAKKQKGEKLTPDEEATLTKDSPRLIAERNKVFAMFSLAMVQKMSRDNVAKYAQEQTEKGNPSTTQLQLKDLAGYNEFVNIIQNEPSGQLKVAAIQALQYMANPDEKAEVEKILTPLLNDSDPMVSKTAKEAIAKFDAAPADTQEANKVA